MTYKEFIDNIIQTRGQWNIPNDEYFEAHHIIPKCMGGEGNARAGRKPTKHPNIVWLYAHEHFIAHKLLAEENPSNKSLVLAWSMMAFPKGKTKRDNSLSPEEYEELRKLQSLAISGKNNPMHGRIPWNKGKTGVYSEETLAKISTSRSHIRGYKLSEETRKRMSVAVRSRAPETFVASHKGEHCYTNGVHNKYLSDDEEIPDGYHRGMTHFCDNSSYKKVWTDEKKKEWSEKFSGEKNPNYGNGEKISGSKNGRAIYIYTFEGVDYGCRDDLMMVLKERYPKITESAIRRLQKGICGEKTYKNFQYVVDNLTWRLKTDEDKIYYKDTIR